MLRRVSLKSLSVIRLFNPFPIRNVRPPRDLSEYASLAARVTPASREEVKETARVDRADRNRRRMPDERRIPA